jgi:hypothetical protein
MRCGVITPDGIAFMIYAAALALGGKYDGMATCPAIGE